MKIFSTPLLSLHIYSDDETETQDSVEKENVVTRRIEELISNDSLESPSETSIQIIMDYGQKKLNSQALGCLD